MQQLCLCGGYALIDFCLIHYLIEGLAQEATVVQLANQVFQQLLVALRQVEVGHLLLQLVVER